jgi:predicted amidophosphoribosyltransferase
MRMLFAVGVTLDGPHVCPNCGERVSAFAAGCALCGADLDPRRGQGRPPLGQGLRRRLAALRRQTLTRAGLREHSSRSSSLPLKRARP